MCVCVCVDRALFPTYVARYLMTQSSPALLEKLEGAVQRELAHLRGNSDVEDKKLFVKVGQWCSKAKAMRAFGRRRAPGVTLFEADVPRGVAVLQQSYLVTETTRSALRHEPVCTEVVLSLATWGCGSCTCHHGTWRVRSLNNILPLPLCCFGFLLARYVPQKARQHNPWYGSSFFHAQAALIDARMIYVHVAVGYRGLYLFYVQDEEVGGRGGTRAVLEEPSPHYPQVLQLLLHA